MMAPPGKATSFYRQGNAWFCNASLKSDISLVVDGVEFHLHKFPLMSKCGRIFKALEKAQGTHEQTFTTRLEEFPGGAEIFLVIVKFCYGNRVEFTPRNIVIVYCGADYLEMTDEYGEDNLLSISDDYFHKNILTNWKDCILALQTCTSMIPRATKLQIINKCLNSLSVMVCTDPGLFGWPMMMYGQYGRLQSPGGSILWNGIDTGAKIQAKASDWWYDDISYLSVPLFEQLIRTMETKGIKPDRIAGAIMYYCKKYLPGLSRWQNGKSDTINRTFVSLSLTPVAVDQKVLIENMVNLLPEKKGKSICRFLLGLLRVALILGTSSSCQETLERRIGMQLDLATLDSLLIPSYSDSDTLYNTGCVERMIQHFISLQAVTTSSPSSGTSPSSQPMCRVAKLIDNYIAEIASDLNLKPERIRVLAEGLPDTSRALHDGLYRAVDIYFKAHPWLSENEKEQLCNIINFEKLSIDACAHASQNERLPLRIVLQVLFFEQLHLRAALAGCLHVVDTESANRGPAGRASDMAVNTVQRDAWVSMMRENEVLKEDLERMRCRVGELEEEFSKMKVEMRKVSKSYSQLSSPRFLARKIGSKLLPARPLDAQPDVVGSPGPTPRASVEHRKSSWPRRSFSLFSNIL
ncbi:unnamed protein product [Cuscuta epithymum]|uniref:Phototropic-responsive NPH3 family protein n=1 Tax=Cuscuta epithymum TaxID=186058 RepID=A0AAV0D6Y1_9ASTE|nr:unnamed protein product [Cuscuta epithymum]